jgi:hypothetical protein
LPMSVFIDFIWHSEQIAIISLNIANQLAYTKER